MHRIEFVDTEYGPLAVLKPEPLEAMIEFGNPHVAAILREARESGEPVESVGERYGWAIREHEQAVRRFAQEVEVAMEKQKKQTPARTMRSRATRKEKKAIRRRRKCSRRKR